MRRFIHEFGSGLEAREMRDTIDRDVRPLDGTPEFDVTTINLKGSNQADDWRAVFPRVEGSAPRPVTYEWPDHNRLHVEAGAERSLMILAEGQEDAGGLQRVFPFPAVTTHVVCYDWLDEHTLAIGPVLNDRLARVPAKVPAELGKVATPRTATEAGDDGSDDDDTDAQPITGEQVRQLLEAKTKAELQQLVAEHRIVADAKASKAAMVDALVQFYVNEAAKAASEGDDDEDEIDDPARS